MPAVGRPSDHHVARLQQSEVGTGTSTLMRPACKPAL